MKDMQIELLDLRAELERERRWYKFVVDQRDRAWAELDALKKLQRGTTARKHKFETPEEEVERDYDE